LSQRRYQHGDAATTESSQPLSHELAHLRIRYKLPGEDAARLIETPITDSDFTANGSTSLKFAAAVAAFGQKLRGGKYLENMTYDDIEELARNARGNDPHGYRGEFMQLVALAGTLDQTANVAHNTQAE
jgi:Ca-activated chloride channel family protein